MWQVNDIIGHNLNKYVEQEKMFVEQLLEDLYVDYTTSGICTVEEWKRFYEKSKNILSR